MKQAVMELVVGWWILRLQLSERGMACPLRLRSLRDVAPGSPTLRATTGREPMHKTPQSLVVYFLHRFHRLRSTSNFDTAGSAIMTKTAIAIAVLFLAVMATPPTVEAAPCLIVTLTGTQGGPPTFNGLAGAGTLVRYGDDSNNCGAVKLQFDAGRGTNMRLSQVGVTPVQLNAIFFTHMHSDHTEGFADIMQLRWHRKGPKIDVVCSSDAVSPLGLTISCKKFVLHIGDAFIQSGEIAQRRSEDKERLPGGPAELANVITFEPKDEPQVVWSSGRLEM
jgi:ribonuclease Z